ncbi:MAG: type IV secretion system DNA-binding domain-containing protein [Flavobacteriaceae bacterium]|nr:type IV secretion system DNA-binding domain-containing protein [Flavobacteriaceae bacterium]
MEESKDLKGLYFFLQGAVYISMIFEFIVFVNIDSSILLFLKKLLLRLPIYENIFLSKGFTFLLLIIVSIGTKAKKDLNLNPKKSILLPIILGFISTVLSVIFYNYPLGHIYYGITTNQILYCSLTFLGVIFFHIAFDNISKILKSNLLKDKFNIENESFEQSTEKEYSDISINLPILFYWNKKVRQGWMNIHDVFRGLLVMGVPGTGKTFGVIVPYIKQLLAKKFTMVIYDYKFPSLTKMSYFHYHLNKSKIPGLKFNIINIADVEYSRRVNPLRPEYINTLGEASDISETLVKSLQKSGEKTGGGSEQFFTQSAINFLSAVIYFLAKYENGKYSTFAHVLNLISRSYADIFPVLYSNEELEEILSAFREAYENETFGQLDGQLGTLRVNLSRLASKETAWVFTGDDIDLRVSSKENPSVTILATTDATRKINAAANALILNQIIKLINTDDDTHKTALVVDETPTTYIHDVDDLISTARSREVAVLIGIQEIPQLVAGYGKTVADKITSVIGNIVSGAVRKKDTLQWLQQLFGKVKQARQGVSIQKSRTTVSINEQMDYLIPESKISNLSQGEVVAQIVGKEKQFDGKYKTGSYNCKINLDVSKIKKEEKNYKMPPKSYIFTNSKEKERVLTENYKKVKAEITELVLKYRE